MLTYLAILLCKKSNIYNGHVIPFFSSHQNRLCSHEARFDPACRLSKARFDILTNTSKLILHLHQLIAHLYFQLQELGPLLTKRCSGAHLLRLPQQMPQSPIFALLTSKPRILAKFCQDGGFIVRPIVVVPPFIDKNCKI
jgi:hypothetical protein